MKAPGKVTATRAGRHEAWCPTTRRCVDDHEAIYVVHFSIKEAADALREHLRTEHPDLFEACWKCRNWDPPEPSDPAWTKCPNCRGRGWTYTKGDES